AGILAEFGKIICISTGHFFRDKGKRLCLQVHSLYGHNEPELLRAFITRTQQFNHRKKIFEFAGHNIREFDIPYICRRLTVQRMPLPDFLQLHNKKPWETQLLDTLNWWKFGDYKNYISLKLLLAVLGLPSAKEEMDGSRVQDVYYKDQNLAGIAEYCAGDVEAVARVILAFRQDEPGPLTRVINEFTLI
ncbi:MAG: ribonuclease H-like domain-containing protein, partial [Dinghuibacter sp.]|nr:ribonuclease H-like domain-containing protein [Dinghuibacter sp.]